MRLWESEWPRNWGLGWEGEGWWLCLMLADLFLPENYNLFQLGSASPSWKDLSPCKMVQTLQFHREVNLTFLCLICTYIFGKLKKKRWISFSQGDNLTFWTWTIQLADKFHKGFRSATESLNSWMVLKSMKYISKCSIFNIVMSQTLLTKP